MKYWERRTVLLLVIVAGFIWAGSTEAQVRAAEKLRVVYSDRQLAEPAVDRE